MKKGKIRFGRYPYTVTRIKAMKSKLLGSEDYLRMKKMGVNEIARFLEEGEYKSEINRFASRYRGAELVELAVNANLAKTVNKILKISIKNEVKELVELYVRKWVINNIKTVLRAKINGVDSEEMRSGIIPVFPTTYEYCERLYQGDNMYIVNNIIKLTEVKKAVIYKQLEEKELVRLENLLDKNYYSGIVLFSQKLALKKNHPLLRFFRYTVDLLNIKNSIRFKKAGMKENEIEDFIIKGGNEDIVKKIIKAKDMEDVINILKTTEYKHLAKKEFLEKLIEFRNEMDRFVLKHALRMLHEDILSVSPIFGYLISKETEARNIKLIVHSKTMGVDEGFIDKNLVIGG